MTHRLLVWLNEGHNVLQCVNLSKPEEVSREPARSAHRPRLFLVSATDSRWKLLIYTFWVTDSFPRPSLLVPVLGEMETIGNYWENSEECVET